MLDDTTIGGELYWTAQDLLQEVAEEIRDWERGGADLAAEAREWEAGTADLSQPLGRTFFSHVVLLMMIGAARGIDPIDVAECFVGQGVLSDA